MRTLTLSIFCLLFAPLALTAQYHFDTYGMHYPPQLTAHEWDSAVARWFLPFAEASATLQDEIYQARTLWGDANWAWDSISVPTHDRVYVSPKLFLGILIHDMVRVDSLKFAYDMARAELRRQRMIDSDMFPLPKWSDYKNKLEDEDYDLLADFMRRILDQFPRPDENIDSDEVFRDLEEIYGKEGIRFGGQYVREFDGLPKPKIADSALREEATRQTLNVIIADSLEILRYLPELEIDQLALDAMRGDTVARNKLEVRRRHDGNTNGWASEAQLRARIEANTFKIDRIKYDIAKRRRAILSY